VRKKVFLLRKGVSPGGGKRTHLVNGLFLRGGGGKRKRRVSTKKGEKGGTAYSLSKNLRFWLNEKKVSRGNQSGKKRVRPLRRKERDAPNHDAMEEEEPLCPI